MQTAVLLLAVNWCALVCWGTGSRLGKCVCCGFRTPGICFSAKPCKNEVFSKTFVVSNNPFLRRILS